MTQERTTNIKAYHIYPDGAFRVETYHPIQSDKDVREFTEQVDRLWNITHAKYEAEKLRRENERRMG